LHYWQSSKTGWDIKKRRKEDSGKNLAKRMNNQMIITIGLASLKRVIISGLYICIQIDLQNPTSEGAEKSKQSEIYRGAVQYCKEAFLKAPYFKTRIGYSVPNSRRKQQVVYGNAE
jgi:hypothetical protein